MTPDDYWQLMVDSARDYAALSRKGGVSYETHWVIPDDDPAWPVPTTRAGCGQEVSVWTLRSAAPSCDACFQLWQAWEAVR